MTGSPEDDDTAPNGAAGSRPPGRAFADRDARDARFEALVAYGADVLTVHDYDGTMRYVSPAVMVNLGYHPDELLGRNAIEFIHPDDQTRLLGDLEAQITNGEFPTPVAYRILHRDGSWCWFEGICRDLSDDPHVQGVLISARNVTDRQLAEQALRAAEAQQRAILENVSELILVVDAEGRIMGEPTGTQVLRYPEGFGAGENIFHYIHPSDRERVLAFLLEKLEQPGLTEPIEMRLRDAHGGWRHCEAIGNNMLHDPVVHGAIITVRDISDRKQGELLLEHQSRVLEMIARSEPLEGILEMLVMMVEEQAESARAAAVVFGGPFEPPRAIASPHLPEGWTLSPESVETIGDAGWINIADEPRHVDDPRFGWSHPITDQSSGALLGTVALFPGERRFPNAAERRAVEVAGSLGAIALERLQAVEELAFRATHDPLTGLSTRSRFQEHLEAAIFSRREQDRTVGVLFIDLDRFKDVNDGLGHDKADRILCVLAERLAQSLRADDLVARFGGDEFAVLAHVEGPQHARLVADRLLERITEPIELDGGEIRISASIGVALPMEGHSDADTLICDADVAMYRAKERGRARVELFDSALRSGLMARIDMESGLRRALEHSEFVVDYQPVVDLRSGRIAGLEALVRWLQPDGRLVSPGEFIPLAEDTGLIVAIGRRVLEESCHQAARWRALRPEAPPIFLAVNLSARQLGHPGLVAEVAGAIDTAGVEASGVSLEITESVLLDDLDGTLRVLENLRDLGVRLVIDDFGTGYSSLEYLKRLPVDVLKIDRGFVSGLGRVGQDGAIVRAVIELSHALGLVVVAEGVEQPIQLRELERFGCDYAQGFLFARPQAPELIDTLLSEDLRPELGATG